MPDHRPLSVQELPKDTRKLLRAYADMWSRKVLKIEDGADSILRLWLRGLLRLEMEKPKGGGDDPHHFRFVPCLPPEAPQLKGRDRALN